MQFRLVEAAAAVPVWDRVAAQEAAEVVTAMVPEPEDVVGRT